MAANLIQKDLIIVFSNIGFENALNYFVALSVEVAVIGEAL